MTKNEIINGIIMDMYEDLPEKLISKLKNSLVTRLYNHDIIEQHTDLMTIEENQNEKYLKMFAVEKRIEGLSDKTIRHYVSESKKMFDFLGKDFRNVTKEDITYYLAHLSSTKNLSNTSLDNTRKYIKAFFNWLVCNDHIIKNPFNKIKSIKRDNVKKEILSDYELEKMRDACVDKRELAVVDFLNCTGVRVSEAIAMKIDDIDFASGKCNIYSKKTKTWRVGFLDAKALKHLIDYRTELSERGIFSEYLFTSNKSVKFTDKKIRDTTMQNILKRVKNRADINKDISVHTFRKTFASRLYKKGLPPMSIATLLGHSDFSTTAKYYIEIDKDGLKYEYDKCMN